MQRAALHAPDLEDVRAERARRRLREFVRQAWGIVEPATKLIWNWHIDALCEHLEAVTSGQIQNLLINVPPGSMKSLNTCVFWPAWVWIPRPEWRVNCWSYSDDLSVRDSIKCRTIIRSDWYRRHFVKGRWRLSDDQDRKDYFQNTRLGFRAALTVGGASTGHRGDAIIIDDPLNAKEAHSKAKRHAVLTAYDQGIGNRLNNMRTGARVVIMQRLHEEDLSGHLLRQGGWEHLCLPSEFEGKRRCVTYIRRPETAASAAASELGPAELPPVGQMAAPEAPAGEEVPAEADRTAFFRDPRGAEGELLFPALFPRSVLVTERTRMGSQGYAGQHQQRPAPDEGVIFKRAWIRRWRREGEFVPEGVEARLLPSRFDEQMISVDATFKDTSKSDYVAMGVWGRLGIDKFLLDQKCDKMDFPETVKALLDLVNAYPLARVKLIEDKANGPAVISVLKKKVSGIIPVDPEGGKEARAHAVAPQFEAGEVFVPLHATWVHAYVEEMVTFPAALHDDQVDQTTQALVRWLTRRSGLAALEALAKR